MYRASDPQRKLFDAGGLLTREKRAACEASWAGPFRHKALAILRQVEGEYADLFHDSLGRPNRPVALVLGALILKDMFDLTDQETLEHLAFDVRWWYALELEPHEIELCQKTLHNFRTEMIKHDKSKVAFRRVSDDLMTALGLTVARQRLDSTHIVSNVAELTRLQLFCETIRVFLRAVRQEGPQPCLEIPRGVLLRHDSDRDYGDARKGESRRRLPVVARDVGRLIEVFGKDEAVTRLEAWTLLKRLCDEQCVVRSEKKEPGENDNDRGEGASDVEPKEPKDIESSSLQTPHDPGVSYSGHKGKGYEVQIAETVGNGDKPEMITDVDVTRSCVSDAKATVTVVQALIEAGHKPEELIADTSYSSASNAAELAKQDVNLLAPCPAMAKPIDGVIYGEPAPKCPKDPEAAAEWLRQREASSDFHARYSMRAGSEATNSEMKRGHGLGTLRVRREERVKLAAYFKALACNVKRALRHWLELQTLAGATAPLA